MICVTSIAGNRIYTAFFGSQAVPGLFLSPWWLDSKGCKHARNACAHNGRPSDTYSVQAWRPNSSQTDGVHVFLRKLRIRPKKQKDPYYKIFNEATGIPTFVQNCCGRVEVTQTSNV